MVVVDVAIDAAAAATTTTATATTTTSDVVGMRVLNGRNEPRDQLFLSVDGRPLLAAAADTTTLHNRCSQSAPRLRRFAQTHLLTRNTIAQLPPIY